MVCYLSKLPKRNMETVDFMTLVEMPD